MFRRIAAHSDQTLETELEALEREHEVGCAILLGMELVYGKVAEPVWPVPTRLQRRSKAFKSPLFPTVDLD